MRNNIRFHKTKSCFFVYLNCSCNSIIICRSIVKFLFRIHNNWQCYYSINLIKIHPNLLELLHFRLKVHTSHFLEKCPKFQVKFLVIFRFFYFIPKPTRDLRLIRLVDVSGIDQHDGSVILFVPYDTTNRLINSSCRLLVIPVTASQSAEHGIPLICNYFIFGVEVVAFKNNFRVIHLWKWNSYNYDHTSCIIREIKTFTDTTTAYTHKNSTTFPILILIN